MQPTLEERLERIDAPKQTDSQNDTLWIINIDTDCNEDTYDNIRVSERYRDPESGRILTQFKDQAFHFNHNTGFQVRWAAQPFTLKPGETAKMPRYLGEHFAYHLCNHMLDKMGPNHRSNPLERPAMLKKIIIKEEPFFSIESDSVGTATLKQVNEMNEGNAPISEVQGLEFNHGGAKGRELPETEQIARDPLHHVDSEVPLETEVIVARLKPEAPEENNDIPEAFKTISKAELVTSIRGMDPSYKFPDSPSKGQLVSILKKIAGV